MISLIVHGGAWDIPVSEVEAHRKGCVAALKLGWEVLRAGGSSIDAVEQAIRYLEDDETFDAGRGSHLNAQGEVELDASIMEGRSLMCGAVAAVQDVRNPITLARKVMEENRHILLVGEGAELFAREKGIEICRPQELITERELKRWKTIKGRESFDQIDSFQSTGSSGDTVGAVALDLEGNICVGTSTGGTLHKYPGRVGDSPLIGAGSYADNELGGVSATGWGESIIRVVMAKTVIDLIETHSGDAQVAAKMGIEILKRKVGGFGGVIVMNALGEFGVSFNTPRMARAYINSRMSEPFADV